MGSNEESDEKVIKLLLGRLLKKYGSVGLLMLIGDFIVSRTKSKKDDKMWVAVKKVLKRF